MPERHAPLPRWMVCVRSTLVAGLAALAWFLVTQAGRRDAPGRWWQGEKMKLEVLVPGCWWWAGLIVAGLMLLLLATSRWWAKSWPAVRPRNLAPAPRWLGPVVLVVMLAGAAVRVPRLDLSLYNDEAHAFRAHLAGEIPKAHLGNPDKFRAVNWWSTLYENRGGNNSLPFSVLARSSYTIWRAASGAPVGRVNETALRLPVLVCGVLSIGAIACLGWRLGGAGTAALVALLTAFHPWHMRYSVEARSYGILLLALPVLFITLEAALRTGRWRHWLSFGAVAGGIVVLWLGTAHLMIALFGMLAVACLSPSLRGRRAALLWPAAVAGTSALGLYLMISLPLHLQLAKALLDPNFFKSPNPFPAEWFQDAAGFLGFGIPGLPVDQLPGGQPSVRELLAGSWLWWGGAGLLVWLAGLTAGGWRFFRQGGIALILMGAFGGGFLLTWIYCVAKGILFLKWYAIFVLPGLLMVLAAGWDRLLQSHAWGWRTVPPGILIFAWMPGLKEYTQHGRENLRGAVELARGASYPASLANPGGTLYGITWSESAVYDPAAITVFDAAALRTLVARDRSENRPLFFAHGHLSKARQEAPGVLALLADPKLFRPTALLTGLDEPSFHHYIYELLPASAPSPAP